MASRSRGRAAQCEIKHNACASVRRHMRRSADALGGRAAEFQKYQLRSNKKKTALARILFKILSPLRAPRGHTSAAPPKRIDNERKVNRMSALRRQTGLHTRNEVVEEILSLEAGAGVRIEKKNRAGGGSAGRSSRTCGGAASFSGALWRGAQGGGRARLQE